MTKTAAEYSKVYRERHPERVRESERKQQRQRRDMLRDLKEKTPCMDCGGSFAHYVMEFDHRPGEDKRANVTALTAANYSVLMREVEKCDIICANCHRKRTHERQQGQAVP